jgi:hypothetical protein
MGILYASELQDPSEWVDQNAQDILDSVKKAGGWKKVFPKGVPTWLHKVRNYFNLEPKTLRLVDKQPTDHACTIFAVTVKGTVSSPNKPRLAMFISTKMPKPGIKWGRAHHHWGGGACGAADAFSTQFSGSKPNSIFKLICPDGTGGSKNDVSNPGSIVRVSCKE